MISTWRPSIVSVMNPPNSDDVIMHARTESCRSVLDNGLTACACNLVVSRQGQVDVVFVEILVAKPRIQGATGALRDAVEVDSDRVSAPLAVLVVLVVAVVLDTRDGAVTRPNKTCGRS